jgi:broad specificity phosphatase PhoE
VTSRRLVLLRHGRTAWNAERRFQGQADPPLDDVGHAQAYEVAGLIATVQPELLVSSDAIRTMETARPIGGLLGLDVIADARFRERSLGHWEGLTRDEVAERFPDEYADWIAGRDVSRRGGETREAVAARSLEAFLELPPVSTTVIVTHSATAMALTAGLLGLRQEVHVLGPLANCHWSEIVTDGHLAGEVTWRLRAHNIGAPGAVVPVPRRAVEVDEAAPDADA